MTDREMPKCPWCGREMHIGYDGKGMAFGRCYFYCDCGAQAPCACVEYATPDDWIGIEGAAYLKATARPMQKPLTVEELKQMCGCPVWVEVIDHTVFADAADDFDGWGLVRHSLVRMWDERRADLVIVDHHFEDCLKEWRCWANRPTEEERKAAEWME